MCIYYSIDTQQELFDAYLIFNWELVLKRRDASNTQKKEKASQITLLLSATQKFFTNKGMLAHSSGTKQRWQARIDPRINIRSVVV